MRRFLSFSLTGATVASVVSVALATAAAASAAPSPAPARAPSPAASLATSHAAGRTAPTAAAAHAPTPGQLRRALTRVDTSAALAQARRAAVTSRRTLDPNTAQLVTDKRGNVRVTVSGTATAVAAAAVRAGGRALVSYQGHSSVVVPKSALGALAAAAGITAVAPANRAYVTGGPSEALGPSGVSTWITNSGNNGTGVKIAIVDAGFTDFASEIAAGHLAAEPVVNTDCTDATGTPSVDLMQHGTAVAEIVHQMAPGADIFPYCVGTNTGFMDAAQSIISYNAAHPTAPITLVTSSLGFYLDGRGDGSDPGPSVDAAVGPSAALAVQDARNAGILWMQSAGNDAEDHWGGTLADTSPKNGVIDLHGIVSGFADSDAVYVPSGGTADIYLQWDQWPTSVARLSLSVQLEQCDSLGCNDGNPAHIVGAPVVVSSMQGQLPGRFKEVQNQSADGQIYVVQILDSGSFPAGVRYDLNYAGDVGPSLNGCSNDLGPCVNVPRAEQQSISAPASSPFAFAVGAHDVLDAAPTTMSSVEGFSSQGPTIDNRVKPDILGYDGVSSWLPEFSSGFFGTSSAAPHVAGAAVLLKALHPLWDASQLQNFLEQQADSGHPVNPPTNPRGHGLLTLPPPAGTALPAGSDYQGLAAPVRILDTRNGTGTGGRIAPLGPGTQVLVAVPGLPADATAVAVNLTGVRAQRPTFLSVYPGGTAWPNTSNLNLTTADATAAVFAIVSVTAAHAITVRNQAGLVDVAMDEVGYFRTNAVAGGRFTPQDSARVLDTRNDKNGKLPSSGNVVVDPVAPAGASAAVVNITATRSQNSGYLAATPVCTTQKTTSTVNYNSSTRANLAVVGLAPDGRFCIANYGGGVDVVVDVLGFMGTSGARYVGLPSPRRVLDTRTGNGPVAPAALGSNGQYVVTGAGIGDVPYDASALFTGVTEAGASAPGYLAAFAGSVRPAGPASTLNFSAGRVVPNAAVVGLDGARQFGIYNSSGQTAVVVDLFGYFE